MRGLSLVVVSRGYSLVAVLGPLLVVAAQASVAAARGLSKCCVGFVALQHVESSAVTRDQTCLPCVGM